MRSIRTQLTTLTLVAVLLSTIAVGITGIIAVRRLGEESSAQILSSRCENVQWALENYLSSVEMAVTTVSTFAAEDLEGLSEPQLHQHLDHVKMIFSSVAGSTSGVLTYYYRIAPEVSEKESGFWYSRFGHTEFVPQVLTDVTAFDDDDISHVGWYSIPRDKGEATWLDPYYNDNLQALMISYVVPIYYQGTFVGVIGIDIEYATLSGQMENFTVYKTGYAFLTDESGRMVYHPTSPLGSDSVAFHEELQRTGQTGSTDKLRYHYNGVEKFAASRILSNGMRLYVTAPVSEINATLNRMVAFIIVIMFVFLSLFMFITAYFSARLTAPLKRLTDAALKLCEGDYSVVLDYHGKDEIGILTGVFTQMRDHLKDTIRDLSSKVYVDALTNVRNKAAFDIMIDRLNEGIPRGETDFAVCFFDCNSLKEINDRYGHDKGDLYLKNSCRLICHTFQHSPVFRLGGDEFAAILTGEDFNRREELLQHFRNSNEQQQHSGESPWNIADLAVGTAVFDPSVDHTANDVVLRADSAMYEDKRRAKTDGYYDGV